MGRYVSTEQIARLSKLNFFVSHKLAKFCSYLQNGSQALERVMRPSPADFVTSYKTCTCLYDNLPVYLKGARSRNVRQF